MVNNRLRTPHYDLPEIKNFVQQKRFELVTPSARRDYKELGWTSREFIAIVQALDVDHHFHKTLTDMGSEIGPLTVDAYRINFNEKSLEEDSSEPQFYLKLAIDPDQPGVAVVSVHLSRYIS